MSFEDLVGASAGGGGRPQRPMASSRGPRGSYGTRCELAPCPRPAWLGRARRPIGNALRELSRHRQARVCALALLGLVAVTLPSCLTVHLTDAHLTTAAQDPAQTSRIPGPKPKRIRIHDGDPIVEIVVTVQHDKARADHTFVEPTSGLRAEFLLVDDATKDGEVLLLNSPNITRLKEGVAKSKALGSIEQLVVLEFKKSDFPILATLPLGARRGLVSRVPFGLTAENAKEEWDANAVEVVQKTK